MAEGWISLHRKIMDNPMWLEEKFDRPRAWIDLLLLANQAPGSIMVRDNRIELEVGDVGWSKLRLSLRWQWSTKKVSAFFKYLQNKSQITLKRNNRITTVISINNYKKYQMKEQQTAQQKNNRLPTNNNDNNENKNTELEKTAKILLDWFNKKLAKNCKTIEPFKTNLAYWLTIYSREEIAKAIARMPNHKFFSQMETPVVIFRRKNQNREDVDYIGQLLNSTPVKNEDLLI